MMRYLIIVAIVMLAIGGDTRPVAAMPAMDISINGNTVPGCPDLMVVPVPAGEIATMSYVDYYIYSVIADAYGVSINYPFPAGNGVLTDRYVDLSGYTGQTVDFINNNVVGLTINLSICRNYNPPPTATIIPTTPASVCASMVSVLVPAGGSSSLGRAGYYIVAGQTTWGIRYSGAELPIWPQVQYIYSSPAVFTNISSESKLFSYCYKLSVSTPTAAPNTVTSDGVVTQCGVSYTTYDVYDEFEISFVLGYEYEIFHDGGVNDLHDDTNGLYVSNNYIGGVGTSYASPPGILMHATHLAEGYTTVYVCRTAIVTTPTITPQPSCYETTDIRSINGYYRSWFPDLNPDEFAYIEGDFFGWTFDTNGEDVDAANAVIIAFTNNNSTTISDILSVVSINIHTTKIALIQDVTKTNGSPMISGKLCVPGYETGLLTATPTSAPTNTALPTATRTSTRTPTNTPTATTSPTATPTAQALPCAIADSVGVPVAPGTSQIYFAPGQQFVVAAANIWLNIGSTAKEIQVGEYTWALAAGSYTAYSLTTPATVWLCAGTAWTPTATNTRTATSAPTWTPGPVPIETAACVPLAATATVISYAMPNLSLVIPLRASATATLTGTAIISITALIALEQTIQAGINTPAAGLATMTGNLSWSSGQLAGATALAFAEPALSWLAIGNPNNQAWTIDGGPLWAVSPFLLPIAPVLVLMFLVVTGRLALWMLDWIIKLARLVLQLIELIPFI